MRNIANLILVLTGLVVGGAGLASLGGCNTTEGFGKDVQNTGSAVSDTAKDAKKSMP